MAQTKHKYNKRKNALNILERKMAKEGWKFKKRIKNTVYFTNEKGDKQKVTLEY